MTRIRLALLARRGGLGRAGGRCSPGARWTASRSSARSRHQALAERAFDEMERALSTWLAREEARPFEHYASTRWPPTQRSPLADPPEHDFVVGAFQIDPDGSVHTPLQPADLAAARARGDWPPAPEVERRIEEVARLVEETWRGERDAALPDAHAAGREGSPADAGAQAAAAGGKRQDPGTTQPVGGLLAGRSLDEAKSGAALADDDANVYEALQRLNRGAEERAARKQKIEEVVIASAASAAGPDPAPSAPAPAPPADTLAEPQAPARERLELETARLEPAAKSIAEIAEPVARMQASAAPADARRDAKLEVVRAALDPMVGRPAGDTHLLVYRTVLVGAGAGSGYRQGLVLDRAQLGAWLDDRALGPSGLSEVAELAFDPAGEPDPSAFVFVHRFAEPFDALAARLTLAPLPGVGGPGAIYRWWRCSRWSVPRGSSRSTGWWRWRSTSPSGAATSSSAVTHELKTPLTAIRMYAEMLRDGLVPSEAKRGEYYATHHRRVGAAVAADRQRARVLAARARRARARAARRARSGPVLEEAADELRAARRARGLRARGRGRRPGLPPVRFDRDALAPGAVQPGRQRDEVRARRPRAAWCSRRAAARPASRRVACATSGRASRAATSRASSSRSTAARTSSRAAPRAPGIGLALVSELSPSAWARRCAAPTPRAAASGCVWRSAPSPPDRGR